MYMHMQGCKTRVLFTDLSSAFNINHPPILAERAVLTGLFGLITWIWDFLMDRLQRLREGITMSEVRFTSIGRAVAPLLYILYLDLYFIHGLLS